MLDSEIEALKREAWNKENGYWPSFYRSGTTCGNCSHSSGRAVKDGYPKPGRCDLIPAKCNEVDIFSGCKNYTEFVIQ